MKLAVLFYMLIAICFSLSAQETYLYCGKLIDTEEGKVLSNMIVLIAGNKIIKISKGYLEPTTSGIRLYG